jgi:hypothetical protein
MKKNAALTEQQLLNTCEHCSRTFVRESTLVKHLCEQKRRWQDRDRPGNRIAFHAWIEFYATCQPSRKKRDLAAFISSPYYSAFVKFGNYCCDINVVNTQEYIKHLLKNNVPIDNWDSDRVYTRYLVEYLKTEDAFDAIGRSVKTLISFADTENLQLRDVLRYASKNKLCHLITTGHISPWLLYFTESGNEFLSTLNEDQRTLIWDYIDTEKWNIKFKRHSDVVAEVKSLIHQAGL